MALAIISTPYAWPSVHGNILFTVNDAAKVADPVSYPNFKYIADVIVGGAPGQVARLKVVPDPVTGIGIFNVGNICRNYVSAPFDPTPNVLLAQEWYNYMSVNMKFGEEWNYTPTYDIVESNFVLLFNSYETRGWTGPLGALFQKVNHPATNRPDKMHVFYNSDALYISYFPDNTAPVPIIITPTGGGFPLTTSYTPLAAYRMAQLNLCPQVINIIQPGTINVSTTSYTIQIGGRTFTVKIICEAINKVYPVHFLNQYGGFDTVFFTKVSRPSVTITKTDYGRLPYMIGSDGVVAYKSINGIYLEQRSVYSSLFQEKLLLNTDFLNDAEYVWLRELLISPMVYLEDELGTFPITITDTDYESKKVVNDDLTNLTMNITFGNQLNAQFR